MNNWPKYREKELIINRNADSGIVIITGWTKKETIYNLLSPQVKQKVMVVGQLYTVRGINYIIRNIFLNKKVSHILVCGEDLSGSLKVFKELLFNYRNDFVEKEIPLRRVNEFIDFFSKHCSFIDQNDLENEIILISNKLLGFWRDDEIEFPNQTYEDFIDLPSEEVVFRLEADKIASLWLIILDRIIKFGTTKLSSYGEPQRELLDVVSVVSSEDPEHLFLPKFLTFSDNELERYYPQILGKKVINGISYTYGSRLRDHDGINQIEAIIKELKRENYSRRAVAFTWNVKKDTGNSKSPCLDLVQALIENNKVYLTAYLRSNDMYEAWPKNAFGLLQLQREIATKVNLNMGKLVIISGSAHIYERDFNNALEKVQAHKPQLECRFDSRGNFYIEVLEEKIKLTHLSSEGKELQSFFGVTAREIMDNIFTFISDIPHALYLGYELRKAEECLLLGKIYIQD